jgi:hypothetical protein
VKENQSATSTFWEMFLEQDSVYRPTHVSMANHCEGLHITRFSAEQAVDLMSSHPSECGLCPISIREYAQLPQLVPTFCAGASIAETVDLHEDPCFSDNRYVVIDFVVGHMERRFFTTYCMSTSQMLISLCCVKKLSALPFS